jgi:hypothetical protein
VFCEIRFVVGGIDTIVGVRVRDTLTVYDDPTLVLKCGVDVVTMYTYTF